MLMPALFTNTSTPPMSRIASARAACTCFRFETSASSAPARLGSSRWIFRPPSASRSSTHTTDPSSRNRAAVAAPMPLAPPVIRIRFALSPRNRTSTQKNRADQDTCLPAIPPSSPNFAHQTLRLRTDLQQQMILEPRRQFRHAIGRRAYRAKVFSLAVVTHPILPGLQSAQFDFAFPVPGRCEERVIHFAVFRDRISLGRVVAGHVKISELAFRKHLLVIQTDPLLPALFFRSGQINVLEFRAGIGPNELRPHHAPGSDRGSEIVAVFFPV